MTRDPEAQAAHGRTSTMAVGVAFLLTLGLFWPTLASFPGTWEGFTMSHGWFVVGLVVWLLWRDRAFLRAGDEGILLALVPMVVFSLLWLAATVAHIRLFHQLSLVVVLVCWGLVVFGARGARLVAVAGVTFLLALPFWDVLVPVLRPLTTLVSGSLVRALRIPAEIQGDLVRIPSGTFHIADGCAGLNYLLAGLVVGAFYALFLVKGWRKQIAVVGLAAFIAIVGNWIRVAAIIVIGHVTEMQSGLVERHLGFGWVVFTLGLVPFFLAARRIEKAARWGTPGLDRDSGVGDGGPEPGTVPGPENGDGERGRAGREEGPPGAVKRVVLASGLAVLGPLLYFGVGALPGVQGGGMALDELPRGEKWQVAEFPHERPFDWRPAYRGEQEHESLAFTDGERFVYGDRFVYREQRQGAKLIGYPNRIAPASDIFEERVIGPVEPSGRLWVRQAVVLTQEGPVLVWYWYRVGGVDTFSPVHAKVLEVPAFLSRRRAAELMALSAVCEPDNCRDAFQALAELMGARFPEPAGGPEASEPVEGGGADDAGEAAEAGGEGPS
jgi:exosortase